MGLTLEQALARTNALYKRLTARRPDIEKAEKYFRGKQPLAYATDEWRKVHQGRYDKFADNWCAVVGRAPGERTEIIGFRLDSKTYEPLTDVERELWNDWELNDLPAQSSQGFLTSTIAKRSHVLVWGDEDDNPVVTWEHPSQVIVDYDPVTRRRRAALKAWVEDDLELATLYTRDEVWKFQRSTSHAIVNVSVNGVTENGLILPTSFTPLGGSEGWAMRQPDEDDTWPVPNPLGAVPVVEFANRPMLGGEPLSDIEGTIAMQDSVNLLWAYLFVAADFASMPARVVLGQEPPKLPILDANGQKVGERPVDSAELTKGRMLWLTGQNSKIDQWDPARLDVFTEVINVAVRHVAAQTSTPIYLVHGELGNVNGETLTGLDAPLVTKVRESQKFYRSPAQDVFSLMAAARGKQDLAAACRRGIVHWRNPETRNDAQVSDAAVKDKQVGWPFQAILERRYGLGQDEIDRYVKMREAEMSDPALESILRESLPGADA